MRMSPTQILPELKVKSVLYRKMILRCIKEAGIGHPGGSLSCIDVLNVLYNCILHVSPDTIHSPSRDRYIHSKGHAVEALYAILAERGFFPENEMYTYCRYLSPYVGHPTRSVNGVEHCTGALGHGLPVSAGIALAGKMDQLDYRTYVLTGDGELVEGSNWEACLFASHYHLDNLVVIVDYNRLQITGRVADVCNIAPLADKFTAFGWAVKCVSGHDIVGLTSVLGSVPFETGKPNVVIAETTKGKGVTFMENDPDWHHRSLTDEQYQAAMAELEASAKLLIRDGCLT